MNTTATQSATAQESEKLSFTLDSGLTVKIGKNTDIGGSKVNQDAHCVNNSPHNLIKHWYSPILKIVHLFATVQPL